MPPRCIKCLTTLMPNATTCPKCGHPAPPQSVLTQERDMDKTQFVHIAPGDLLPEDELPGELPPMPLTPSSAAIRRSLALAVLLGLLVGVFLILVVVGMSRARH